VPGIPHSLLVQRLRVLGTGRRRRGSHRRQGQAHRSAL